MILSSRKLKSPKFYSFFLFFRLLARAMTAPAVNFSPSHRPPPSFISPSPSTAWAAILGLNLNVLHDHIRFSAPDIFANIPEKLVNMMKSAAGTVVGSAALDAARAALSPFVELHHQITSIRNRHAACSPHISPVTPNVPHSHPSSSSPAKPEWPMMPPGHSNSD